jgi:hypothetical protein
MMPVMMTHLHIIIMLFSFGNQFHCPLYVHAQRRPALAWRPPQGKTIPCCTTEMMMVVNGQDAHAGLQAPVRVTVGPGTRSRPAGRILVY